MRILIDAAIVTTAIIMGLPWYFTMLIVLITAISIVKDFRDENI